VSDPSIITGRGLRELRPHQILALQGLKTSIATGHRAPVLQAACGFGKTVVAAHIIDGALNKNKRLAFCVPSLGLVDQTFQRFCENGIDPVEMGVIQGDHPWRRPHAPIQICSAQTLARRAWPEVDIVVIDEAHIRFKTYNDWMTHPDWQKVPFIALTATPWASGMGKYFDDLIRPISMQELIDQGYLSPFRVFAPSHPDLAGVKTVAGDYHAGQLAERMNKPKLVADIVATWLARGEGRPTICFAIDCLHAQSIQEQFRSAGVAAAYIDADTPRAERDDIGKQLASGEVQVVCSVGCLIAGIDWDVRCIIFARPTKSQILFVQAIGRGLRTAPEGTAPKDHCIILDHSDTTLRLGFVTDIDLVNTTLDDGSDKASKSKKDDEDDLPLPKACPACAALVPAGINECPCCGHTIRRVSDIKPADGALAELVSGTKRAPGKEPSSAELLKQMNPAQVWSEIKGLQLERTRSDGWAAHTFKAVFGTWPPRSWTDVGTQTASYTLRAFVRSRDIAYAKAMEKQRKVEGDQHAKH